MSDLLDRVRRAVGYCADAGDLASDIADLQTSVDVAERLLRSRRNAAELGLMGRHLTQARQNLRSLSSGLSRTTDICSRLQSVDRVTTAAATLNRLGAINQTNSRQAAQAFGQLFAGLGDLASLLPPPLSTYAQFLSGMADFFVNMEQHLNPSLRPRERRAARAAGIRLP